MPKKIKKNKVEDKEKIIISYPMFKMNGNGIELEIRHCPSFNVTVVGFESSHNRTENDFDSIKSLEDHIELLVEAVKELKRLKKNQKKG